MTTLNLYDDAALTTAATVPLAFAQDTLGAISPHQRRFYLGQATAGYRFRANSDPGVDSIELSIVDAVPASGQPATAIKLATTQAGLTGAVAGDPLDLGATLLSGSANAVQVWVQFDDATATVATDTDVSLAMNELLVDEP
jgi:hypothetical protein